MAEQKVNLIITAKDQASGVLKGIGGVVSSSLKIAGVAIVAAGVAGVKAAADFETMGVALKTALGGSEKAAKKAQDQIVKFAAKTPFQVGEVMTAFIKLKNMGLDPGEKACRFID